MHARNIAHNLKERLRVKCTAMILTAPFDLCKTGILSLFAGFNSIETLIPIALLICANVTLQGVACGKNIIENNRVKKERVKRSRLYHLPNDTHEITSSAKCHFVKFGISGK